MKTRDAFQFNACPRVPSVLHRTEMEIVEFCNARFRRYYPVLAEAALTRAITEGFTTIVELGAGCGPLTERMAADPRSAGIRFIVCDLIPDRAAFRRLVERFPDRVEAIYEPVDFSERREWGAKTLLLLSAAFHHVPVENRADVLRTLRESAGGVMIFSTVRKTPWCLLTAPLVVFPALLLPIAFRHRPGRLRRILWCWLLPLAPLMMMWDAVGGCLRQWSRRDWQLADGPSPTSRPLDVREALNVQTVVA
ncbi:MAG: hypothetical protein C0483_11310 [Pirellula sp.]|nr:hypothetical protein [Pirellula sp.]